MMCVNLYNMLCFLSLSLFFIFLPSLSSLPFAPTQPTCGKASTTPTSSPTFFSSPFSSLPFSTYASSNDGSYIPPTIVSYDSQSNVFWTSFSTSISLNFVGALPNGTFQIFVNLFIGQQLSDLNFGGAPNLNIFTLPSVIFNGNPCDIQRNFLPLASHNDSVGFPYILCLETIEKNNFTIYQLDGINGKAIEVFTHSSSVIHSPIDGVPLTFGIAVIMESLHSLCFSLVKYNNQVTYSHIVFSSFPSQQIMNSPPPYVILNTSNSQSSICNHFYGNFVIDESHHSLWTFCQPTQQTSDFAFLLKIPLPSSPNNSSVWNFPSDPYISNYYFQYGVPTLILDSVYEILYMSQQGNPEIFKISLNSPASSTNIYGDTALAPLSISRPITVFSPPQPYYGFSSSPSLLITGSYLYNNVIAIFSESLGMTFIVDDSICPYSGNPPLTVNGKQGEIIIGCPTTGPILTPPLNDFIDFTIASSTFFTPTQPFTIHPSSGVIISSVNIQGLSQVAGTAGGTLIPIIPNVICNTPTSTTLFEFPQQQGGGGGGGDFLIITCQYYIPQILYQNIPSNYFYPVGFIPQKPILMTILQCYRIVNIISLSPLPFIAISCLSDGIFFFNISSPTYMGGMDSPLIPSFTLSSYNPQGIHWIPQTNQLMFTDNLFTLWVCNITLDGLNHPETLTAQSFPPMLTVNFITLSVSPMDFPLPHHIFIAANSQVFAMTLPIQDISNPLITVISPMFSLFLTPHPIMKTMIFQGCPSANCLYTVDSQLSVNLFSQITYGQSGNVLSKFLVTSYGDMFVFTASHLISLNPNDGSYDVFSSCAPATSNVISNPMTGILYMFCDGRGIVAITHPFQCAEGFVWSSQSCVSCNVGTFRDGAQLNNSIECSSPPKGQFASSPALVSSCPLGYFQSSSQQTGCSPCSPGEFTPSVGASACTSCIIGKFSNSFGSARCTDCLMGQYTISNGSVVCFDSSAGFFTNTSGFPLPYALPCPEGWASNEVIRSTGCSPSPMAFYAPPGTANQTILPCPSASYCPGGTSQPLNIAGGKIGIKCASNNQSLENCEIAPMNKATGITDCPQGFQCQNGNLEACAIGRFSPQGSVLCSECQPGTFQPLMGMSNCSLCIDGHYTNDSAHCIEVPKGFFTNVLTGFSIPQSCPSGTFQILSGKSSCDLCVAGKYSVASSSGTTTCLDCIGITYSASPGSQTCSICSSRGYFVNSNHTACVTDPCGPGLRLTSSSTCIPCSPGTFSVANSNNPYVCPTCPSGFANFAFGQSQCFSCQGITGISCDNKYGLPLVNAGYFGQIFDNPLLSPQNQYIINTKQFINFDFTQSTGGVNQSFILQLSPLKSFAAYLCPNGFCNGNVYLMDVSLEFFESFTRYEERDIQQANNNQSSGNTVLLDSSLLSAIQSQSACANHRSNDPSNTLCGQCIQGYVQQGGECVQCDHADYGLLIGLLLLCFIYVFALHIFSQSSSGDVKVLLFFISSLILILQQSNIALTWLEFFNFSPLSSSSSRCVLSVTPYEDIAMAIIIPLLFFGILYTMALLHWISSTRRLFDKCFQYITHKFQNNPNFNIQFFSSSSFKSFSLSPYLRTSLALVLFSFQQIATGCIRFLSCTQVGDISVVFTSPAIVCGSPTYKQYYPAVLLILLLNVITVPSVIFIFFIRHRQGIQKGEIHIKSKYGILFESFNHHGGYGHFYQIFMLIRQVILIGIQSAEVTNHSAQFLGFSLFALFALLIPLITKPFRIRHHNGLEVTAFIVLLFVCILLTPFPQSSSTPLSVTVIVGVSVILFVGYLIALIVISRMLKTTLHKIYEEWKQGQSKSVGSLLSKQGFLLWLARLRYELQSESSDANGHQIFVTSPVGTTRKSNAFDNAQSNVFPVSMAEMSVAPPRWRSSTSEIPVGFGLGNSEISTLTEDLPTKDQMTHRASATNNPLIELQWANQNQTVRHSQSQTQWTNQE